MILFQPVAFRRLLGRQGGNVEVQSVRVLRRRSVIWHVQFFLLLLPLQSYSPLCECRRESCKGPHTHIV